MNTSSLLHHAGRAWQLVIVPLFIGVVASGCSIEGGTTTAGVGTGGTGSVAKTVSGTVADGYLVNATVFLDRNGNYRLDSDEPFTTTDSNGAYALKIDQSDLGKYAIVALAIKGDTVDKDRNKPVANSFILSLPKEGVNERFSNCFISPVTSQLREMLETGTYSTLQEATEILRQKMGMPVGTDLLSDYMIPGDRALHVTAQNLASLMGRQMDNVMLSTDSAPAADVNRYRGMMAMLFSNMSSVKGGTNDTDLTRIHDTITMVVTNIPRTHDGKAYQNMSTFYRPVKGPEKR